MASKAELKHRLLEIRLREIEIKEANLRKQAPVSKPEALLQGLAQGATLGLADELGAAVEAAPRTGGILGFTRAEEPLLGGEVVERPSFEEALTQRQEELSRVQQKQPAAFAAGDIVGSLLSLAVPGAGLARGGATLARLAGTGAAIGGISAAGRAEEGERLQAGLLGASAGALTGLAGAAAGRALQTSSDLIQRAVGGQLGSGARSGAIRSILDRAGDSLKTDAERIVAASKRIKVEDRVRKEAEKIAKNALTTQEKLAGKTVEQKLAELAAEIPGPSLGILGQIGSAVVSPSGFVAKQAVQRQEQLRTAGRAALPVISAQEQSLAPNLFRRAQ